MGLSDKAAPGGMLKVTHKSELQGAHVRLLLSPAPKHFYQKQTAAWGALQILTQKDLLFKGCLLYAGCADTMHSQVGAAKGVPQGSGGFSVGSQRQTSLFLS